MIAPQDNFIYLSNHWESDHMSMDKNTVPSE